MADIDREETEEVVRQVGDVPRIGVAEPLTEWPLSLDLPPGSKRNDYREHKEKGLPGRYRSR